MFGVLSGSAVLIVIETLWYTTICAIGSLGWAREWYRNHLRPIEAAAGMVFIGLGIELLAR